MKNNTSYNRFKDTWPIWFLLLGIIVIVLFLMNQKEHEQAVPVNELLPASQEVQNEKAPNIPERPASASQSPEKSTPQISAVSQENTDSMRPAISSPQVPPVANESTNKTLTIQVASFKEKPQAEQALNKIKKEGFEGYLVTKDLKEKGVWYRLYVGEFATKAEADQVLEKLKATYKDSFVIMR